MLGFALDLRQGELLYSVLARYSALLGKWEGRALVGEFLGVTANVAAIDLPAGVQRFAARMGEKVDPEALIQNHTLFPYLYRFAPQSLREHARAWLLNGGPRKPARIGVSANAFELPYSLRFCPRCVRENAREGLSPWLCVHQLPGVLLCPEHGTSLVLSQVTRRNRRGLNAFVALTPGLAAHVTVPAFPMRQREHLLRFARESKRLLEMPAQPCSLPEFQQRLHALLSAYRWSRAPSLMASAQLVAAFKKNVAIQVLLSAMGVCWTDSQIATAFNRVLYRGHAAKHPLTVLLLLRIAGATLDDLFAPTPPPATERNGPSPKRTGPAARGDLPCGNPACARHRGLLTAQLSWGFGTLNRTRARCPECGFTYVWDPQCPSRTAIVETSPSWDRILLGQLSEPGISVREIGRRLSVAPNTVMRHARRLGVWRPEWKDRPKLQLRQVTRPGRLLEGHRAAWLAHRSSGQSVPIKEMPETAFNAYRYLMKHDRGWLRENEPPSRG